MSPTATILGPHEQLSHAGAAGRPVLNVETRILDASGRIAAQDEVGEIVHRSPQATLGYYKNEGKTAEAFEDGWFHSGGYKTPKRVVIADGLPKNPSGKILKLDLRETYGTV